MKRQYRLPGAEIQNGTRAVLAHAPLGARKPCTLTKKRPPASHSRPPLGKSYVPPCSPLKRTKTAVKRYSERLIIPRPSLKNAAARAKTPQHLRLSAGGVYTGRASSPHLPGGRHTKHISHSTAPRIIRCLPRRRRISPVRRRPYIRCASRATQQGFHPHKPYEPIQHIGTSESGRNATKSIVTLKKRGGIHEQIPVRKFPFHQNRRHFSPPTRIESRTKTECVRICFTLKSAQKTDFPIRTTLPQILCAIPIRIKNAFQLRTSQSRLLSVWIIPSVPLLKSAAARV